MILFLKFLAGITENLVILRFPVFFLFAVIIVGLYFDNKTDIYEKEYAEKVAGKTNISDEFHNRYRKYSQYSRINSVAFFSCGALFLAVLFFGGLWDNSLSYNLFLSILFLLSVTGVVSGVLRFLKYRLFCLYFSPAK